MITLIQSPESRVIRVWEEFSVEEEAVSELDSGARQAEVVRAPGLVHLVLGLQVGLQPRRVLLEIKILRVHWHELIKLLHEVRQCGYNRIHFLLEHIDHLLWRHYS